MILKEHENAVLNAIDKAAKELTPDEWNYFLETVTEYLNEKDEEITD